MKYRCKICHYIYEEEKEGRIFSTLENFKCPMCFVPREMFEEYEDKQKEEANNIFKKAVIIDIDNPGIKKDDSRCIDCGLCKETCEKVCGLDCRNEPYRCLSCGQCIITCPLNALIPKNSLDEILNAKKEGKILICYTSPAVRVSVGEAFGFDSGTFLLEELIGALKELGFDYVFDTTFGADLTIIEEANELKTRINSNGILPMFTSCCPAWIKFAEENYPEVLNHISTCKSPIAMQGIMIKNYFAQKNNLNSKEIFTVAITPCTAKKMEIKRPEIEGTDVVLTIQEVIQWLKKEKIDIKLVKKRKADPVFQEGSGAGTLFGKTGGVTESALRTLSYLMTGNSLEESNLLVNQIDENKKEIIVNLDGIEIKSLVIHQLSKAKEIVEQVKKGNCPYHLIEIMNCPGGCIGGGGQPKYALEMEKVVKAKRMAGLMERDKENKIYHAHENPDIKAIYQEFLIKANEEIAHKYLHTTYKNNPNCVN